MHKQLEYTQIYIYIEREREKEVACVFAEDEYFDSMTSTNKGGASISLIQCTNSLNLVPNINVFLVGGFNPFEKY